MLSHPPFYHQHFKKYVTAFGTIFNDIVFQRKDKNGAVAKTIKVPLSFVNKDKALERLQQDPELENTWALPLPRMAFQCVGINYDTTRKTNSVNYISKDSSGLTRSTQFSPAPYDIQFELYIWVNYFEDALQVVEQILPFFQPEYVVKVKEVPELGIDRDIPIILEAVNFTDQIEGNFDEERLIEWTLTFTLKGYFFGPVESRSVIKTSTATSYFQPDMEGYYSSVSWTVDPLDAMKDQPGSSLVETKSEGLKE